MHLRRNGLSGVAAALLLPGLLVFRRRKSLSVLARSAVVTLLLMGSLGAGTLLSGCSSNSMPPTATPAGTSNVVITATSGSISQTTTVAITVM